MPDSYKRQDWLIGAALAATFLSIYLPFLSQGFVEEGLYRAMPIETHHLNHLLAGNYLLYGPLGYVFHSLLGQLGLHPLAVLSLQFMDALLGSAGVMIFYLSLRTIGSSVGEGAIWSAIFGLTLGHWLWSTEAEDYIFSTFLLQINFLVLLGEIRRGRIAPLRLGLFHALAMMGHIVNGLYGVVVLWTIYRVERPAWKKSAMIYLFTVVCAVIVIYAAVIVGLKGFRDVAQAASWFSGSAGAHGGVRLGGAPSLGKTIEWLRMSGHIFFSFQPAYASPRGWTIAPIFLGLAKAALLFFIGGAFFVRKDFSTDHATVASAALLWVAAYALMFTRWEPSTMVYRVSDLVPLVTLFFLIAHYWKSRWRPSRFIAPVLAIGLGVGNLGAEIYPRSFASNNAELQMMRFIHHQTQEGDWIMGSGGVEEIYVPYFAQRPPLLVERYSGRAPELAIVIHQLLTHGQPVYATDRALADPIWTTISHDFTVSLKATDPAGNHLYQIALPTRPHA